MKALTRMYAPPLARPFQRLDDERAGRDLLGLGDRILQVEDHIVGAAVEDLHDLPRMVAGGEEKAAVRGHGTSLVQLTARLSSVRLRVSTANRANATACTTSMAARTPTMAATPPLAEQDTTRAARRPWSGGRSFADARAAHAVACS